jgi:hypothetical protein
MRMQRVYAFHVEGLFTPAMVPCALGSVSYQRPDEMTHRRRSHIMAGEGPPSTSLLMAVTKAVDTDLRRHDDVGVPNESSHRAIGIITRQPDYSGCSG